MMNKQKTQLSKFTVTIISISIVKILVMGLFSSDYQNQLFIPFVLSFVEGNVENPYSFFWANGIKSAFPYPIVMLLIESVGGALIALLGITDIFL